MSYNLGHLKILKIQITSVCWTLDNHGLCACFVVEMDIDFDGSIKSSGFCWSSCWMFWSDDMNPQAVYAHFTHLTVWSHGKFFVFWNLFGFAKTP